MAYTRNGKTVKPKHVRNAWLTVESNARKTPLSTGPIGDRGGMTVSLDLREHGDIGNTRLVTHVYTNNDATKIRVVISETTVLDDANTFTRKVYDREFDR